MANGESRSQLSRTAIEGALLTTVAHGIATLAQIGYFLYAARVLGPAPVGRYQLVIIIVTFLTLIADLGLGDALVRDRAPLRARFFQMMRRVFPASVAVAVLGTTITMWGPWSGGFVSALLLVIWIPVFDTPSWIVEKALHRSMAFRRVSAIEASMHMLHAGLGILLLTRNAEVGSMLTAFVVWRATRALLLTLGLWRRPDFDGDRSSAPPIDREMTHFGLAVVAERMLSNLNSRLDRILLGALAGEAAVGVLALTRQLFLDPVLRVTPILFTVAQPVLARVQDEDATFRHYLLQLYKGVSVVLLPAVVGMLLVFPGILEVVIGGEGWENVRVLAPAIAVAALLKIWILPTSISALARGWAGRNLVIAGLYFAALMIGLPVGWHFAGLAGVGWGFAFAVFTQSIAVRALILGSGHRIGLLAVGRQLLFPVACVAAMVVVVGIVRPDGSWTLRSLVISILSGGLTYAGLLLLLDRAWLFGLLRRRSGG